MRGFEIDEGTMVDVLELSNVEARGRNDVEGVSIMTIWVLGIDIATEGTNSVLNLTRGMMKKSE